MSKNATRKETNCLNCGFTDVTDRFCPKCGQENIPSHLSFSALAYHAIEDLTHYDNAFWKTMRYLLFHPARLTKVYLSGKRKQFVPPIKLYIFISFVTFFLPTILPPIDPENPEAHGVLKKEVTANETGKARDEGISFMGSKRIKSIEELEHYQDSLPQNKKMGSLRYKLFKGLINAEKQKHSTDDSNKFEEIYFHNVPKAIFLYLPVFGFFLWLFHSKKRWFFFDHAIFTFHYFSFIYLLLTISITILERIYVRIPNENIADTISMASGILTISWLFVYFYIAHKRIYQESGMVSFIKSTALLLINLILFSLLMLALALYTIINIH
ncbi:MAG: DUF3667 domain-containing protein [Flavobacterium sp.]|nr:DUF3667 domain-containing protein [Flavobacterium sp.]